MTYKIQTISPGTLSYTILKVHARHQLWMKMQNPKVLRWVPFDSATQEHELRPGDGRRLGATKVNKLVAKEYGICRSVLYSDEHTNFRQGLHHAEKRLVNAGLIHVRWKWFNKRSHEWLIPDYWLTEEGLEALAMLDSGATVVLDWNGSDLLRRTCPEECECEERAEDD